jgi:hypothetical protein
LGQAPTEFTLERHIGSERHQDEGDVVLGPGARLLYDISES